MPAYNFKNQFSELVERGLKLQTIRKTKKRAKVGDTAYLYTGQRTTQCRKLGEGIITQVIPIQLYYITLRGFRYGSQPVAHIGDMLNLFGSDLDAFARSDGFGNGLHMIDFFNATYGLPFTGFLHQWVLKKGDENET